MRRLRKSDVEELLDRYDADPIGALTLALSRLLDQPSQGFDALVDHAPLIAADRTLLHRRDVAALDALATRLNEQRSL